MFNSIKEMEKAFKNGERTLQDDEYIGENGLLYCKKCHTPKYCEIEKDGNKYVIPVLCKHMMEERAHEQFVLETQKQQENYLMLQKKSCLSERYKQATFDKAIITEHNRSVYDKCHAYAENAAKMLEQDIGIYIFGDNSSGKTYLSACLCNALMHKGFTCLHTNLSNILSVILGKKSSGMDENDLVNCITYSNFVFLDDLGKEFIGREYDNKRALWAEEKLFEIVNTRYNTQKPIIFTSNYSINDLQKLNLDKGIIERIQDMSTVNLKLSGENFRQENRSKKREIAKQYGVL